MPQTIAQLPCYCNCDEGFGHKSLQTCLVDEHAAHYAVCVEEALAAYRLKKQGYIWSRDAVTKLLGGPPEEFPERYQQTSPTELPPLGVRQWLIHGTRDTIVPVGQSKEYAAAARRKGDGVKVSVLDGTGHLDLIAPQSSAWPAVAEAVRALLNK